MEERQLKFVVTISVANKFVLSAMTNNPSGQKKSSIFRRFSFFKPMPFFIYTIVVCSSQEIYSKFYFTF
jgi:hypothetical protein